MRLLLAIIMLSAYACGVASAQRQQWVVLFVCSMVFGMCIAGIYRRSRAMAMREQRDERIRDLGGEP